MTGPTRQRRTGASTLSCDELSSAEKLTVTTQPNCGRRRHAVYAAVYAPVVRRTNIYLTLAEQAALDARAAAEGSTRSEVLRALVDRELNLETESSGEVDAALVELAGELAERSRQLSADDPDLASSE